MGELWEWVDRRKEFGGGVFPEDLEISDLDPPLEGRVDRRWDLGMIPPLVDCVRHSAGGFGRSFFFVK
jgi:hypothetical protein